MNLVTSYSPSSTPRGSINALERTNLKFIKRFNYIEARAKEKGKELKDMSLAEMDELWDEAKKSEA